jgi:hypothetical protein
MLALRYAYLLALVFWLGGLLAIGGIAAPAIFEALSAASGVPGRELAGLTVGAVLRQFYVATCFAAAVMLASFTLMAALGPRPVRFAVRLSILVAMTAVTLYSGFVLGPRVQRMQRDIGGPVAALPEQDSRRVAFGRLHGLSTALLMLTAAGGLVLVYWEARTHE